MFTRLIISTDSTTTVLEAHEVLAVLLGLPNKVIGVLNESELCSKIQFPDQGYLNELHHHPISELWLEEGRHDEMILLPARIQYQTIQHLFFITHKLKNETNSSNKGWWVELGARLLYVNNQDKRKQFYIADYGNIGDIYDRMRHKLLRTNWIEYPPDMQGIELLGIPVGEFAEQFNNPDPEAIKKMRELLQLLPYDALHDIYPSRSSEDLWTLRQLILTDDAYAKAEYRRLYTEYKYIVALQDAYKELHRTKKISQEHPPLAVGFEVMKKVNFGEKGEEYPFLRPTHAYGEVDSDGASYRIFADSIANYVEKFQDTVSELAQKVRSVLQQTFIPGETLRFLPNLVAAWFIAEATRNHNTIPTSLMLLDLLEDPMTIQQLSLAVRRKVTWNDVFLSPVDYDPTAQPLQMDLYGTDLSSKTKLHNTTPYTLFRGLHPMVHLNSRLDIDTQLGDNQPLSRVRQKEASIILQWLAQQFKQTLGNGYRIELIAFNPTQAETYLKKPNYSDVCKFFGNPSLSKNFTKRLQSEPARQLKYQLLQQAKGLFQQRCASFNTFIARSTLPLQKPNSPLPASSEIAQFSIDTNISYNYNLYEIVNQEVERIYQKSYQIAQLINVIRENFTSNLDDSILSLRQILTDRIRSRLLPSDFNLIEGFFQSINMDRPMIGSIAQGLSVLKNQIVSSMIAAYQQRRQSLSGLSHLSPDIARLRIYLMLQLADAVWLQERIHFIRSTLSLPHLTEPEMSSLTQRSQALLEDAKRIDAWYDSKMNDVMQEILKTYLKKLGTSPTVVNELELNWMAQFYQINIRCFNTAYDETSVPITCLDQDQIHRAYLWRTSRYSPDKPCIDILYDGREGNRLFLIRPLNTLVQSLPCKQAFSIALNLVQQHCNESSPVTTAIPVHEPLSQRRYRLFESCLSKKTAVESRIKFD